MLELFTKKPVFQGEHEIHQLEVIFRIFGTPTVQRWHGLVDMPWYELVKPKEIIENHFRDMFRRWASIHQGLIIMTDQLNIDGCHRRLSFLLRSFWIMILEDVSRPHRLSNRHTSKTRSHEKLFQSGRFSMVHLRLL